MTIQEVVASYVPSYEVNGNQLTAECPFSSEHQGGTDRHPSFGVNLVSGLWNCFSCESGGTFGSFLRKLKHPFAHSWKRWITQDGDYPVSPEGCSIDKPNYCLPTDRGKCSYLVRKRGFTQEVLDEYGIYYSINEGGAVIPIRSQAGDEQGYQVRRLGKVTPKYLSRVRGAVLFGIDKIQPHSTIVVVEGPMDVLRLSMHGIKAVATLRSKVTRHQVSLLASLPQKKLIVFDGDEAGRKGTKRLLSQLPNSKELLIPDGYDPDSLKKDYIDGVLRWMI